VNIGCRGRNRTCERQINNLPSVPAHKPYKIRGQPSAGRPLRTEPVLCSLLPLPDFRCAGLGPRS
jgi:hypothetical protein